MFCAQSTYCSADNPPVASTENKRAGLTTTHPNYCELRQVSIWQTPTAIQTADCGPVPPELVLGGWVPGDVVLGGVVVPGLVCGLGAVPGNGVHGVVVGDVLGEVVPVCGVTAPGV